MVKTAGANQVSLVSNMNEVAEVVNEASPTCSSSTDTEEVNILDPDTCKEGDLFHDNAGKTLCCSFVWCLTPCAFLCACQQRAVSIMLDFYCSLERLPLHKR